MSKLLSLIADHTRAMLGERHDLLTVARCAAAIGVSARLGLAIRLPAQFGRRPASLGDCMTVLAWDPFRQHVLVIGFTRDVDEVKRIGLSLPEDDYPRQCVIVGHLFREPSAKWRMFLDDWLRDRCRLADAQHRERVIDGLMNLGKEVS